MEWKGLSLDKVSAFYLLNSLPGGRNEKELVDMLRCDRVLTFADLNSFLDGATPSWEKFRKSGRYNDYHTLLSKELDDAVAFCEKFNSSGRVPPKIWSVPNVKGIDSSIVDDTDWLQCCSVLDVVYPAFKNRYTYPGKLKIAELKSLFSCVEPEFTCDGKCKNSLIELCGMKSITVESYVSSVSRYQEFLVYMMHDINKRGDYESGMDVFDYKIADRREIVIRHMSEFVHLISKYRLQSFRFGNLTKQRLADLERCVYGTNDNYSLWVDYIAHFCTPSELIDFDRSSVPLENSTLRRKLVRRLTK